jgi:putative ABC transport system permease protein
LVRHPGFAVVAVITLTLAIGVNTTIFSVVNAVLLKALPFRDPQQLVSVHSAPSASGLPGIAAYQYIAWNDHNTTFDDLAAFTDNNFNLTVDSVLCDRDGSGVDTGVAGDARGSANRAQR